MSVPWRLVTASGRLVKVRWVGGGCLTPDRTTWLQTPRHVEIAVLAHLYVPGRGESCAAYAHIYAVRIRLREPLGTRKLLHAPITPGPLI